MTFTFRKREEKEKEKEKERGENTALTTDIVKGSILSIQRVDKAQNGNVFLLACSV